LTIRTPSRPWWKGYASSRATRAGPSASSREKRAAVSALCALSPIATRLQARGYRTGLFGKYLNGYPGTPGREYIPAGWTEWASLGAPPSGAILVRVTSIRGGGLVVFALGADGSIYHLWQEKPLDGWQPWWPLGGLAKDFAVSKTPSGGLAVFAIGPDDTVRYRYQSKPFGDWGPWKRLEGRFRHLAVQTSYLDEGLEVFAIDLDDVIYHSWRDSSEGPWTAWRRLEHEPAVDLSVPTGSSASRT